MWCKKMRKFIKKRTPKKKRVLPNDCTTWCDFFKWRLKKIVRDNNFQSCFILRVFFIHFSMNNFYFELLMTIIVIMPICKVHVTFFVHNCVQIIINFRNNVNKKRMEFSHIKMIIKWWRNEYKSSFSLVFYALFYFLNAFWLKRQ